MNTLKDYQAHKNRAKRRGVEFLFTYIEWKTMWDNSGKIRGRASDEYCMARHNDVGPYSIDNVSIVTNRENSQFAVSHRNIDIWLPAIRAARQNPEWKTKISGLGNNQFKGSVKGTCKTTGKQITLTGKNEMIGAGFLHQSIYKCLNGKLNSHGGYTWERM